MSEQKYNPHLDGLRGIAILLVIGYHYLQQTPIFHIGWSGVDLFFVLSGYLLTGRIYPYLKDKKILLKFYFNRILRIIPLYYLFLVVFFFTFFYWGSPNLILSFPNYKNKIVEFFLFFSNWIFIYNLDIRHDHLNHLWSLAVEEQYYIFLPIFILLVKEKKKLLWTGVIIIIFTIIFRLAYYYYFKATFDQIYWNSFCRMDSFIMGYLLYIILAEKKYQSMLNKYNKWVTLVSFLLIVIGLSIEGTMHFEKFISTIGYTLISIFYCSVLYWILSEESSYIKNLTSLKFLKHIGKISFGLYLFNWPIFVLSSSLLNSFIKKLNIILSENSILPICIIFSLLLTYTISYISYKYYEPMFLKWKKHPQIIKN